MSAEPRLKLCEACHVARRDFTGCSSTCDECRAAPASRRCRLCGLQKPIVCFSTYTGTTALRSQCRECRTARQKVKDHRKTAAGRAAAAGLTLARCAAMTRQVGKSAVRQCKRQALVGSDYCSDSTHRKRPRAVPESPLPAASAPVDVRAEQLRVCAKALQAVRDNRTYGLEWARDVARKAIDVCAGLEP